MQKICYSLFVALSALLMLPALASAQKVHEFMLDNGMKLLVKEDHRAPIAVSQIWYKVGSSYEPEGITGVSHVLEHMMFKGTKKHGPNQFSHIISENGGRENAFTGTDYTAYFQTISSDRLDVAFELEADRMRNLLLDPKEFKKEVQVVIEERRMRTDDKPTSMTYEQFQAVAYRVLPYRQPIIGWRSDLENLAIEDLQQWYSRWYAPNNATLVVVGDVDPQEIKTMVDATFGKIPSQSLRPVKPSVEPEQLGEVRLQVRAPARQPYLLMGYKTPTIATAEKEKQWEPYALEILAAILDGGESARFSRELVRGSRVAASAGLGYNMHARLSTLMIIEGIPGEGKGVAVLEEALLAEIEKLKHELVDASELKRIITQTVAAKVYERDSVFYQAMQLGKLETVGLDWRMSDTEIDKLKAVTPQQIQSVAKRYFIAKNRTVAMLDPQPMDDEQALKQQRAQQMGGASHAH
ncbi:MAG: pitrilysin family protein [Pseudomonadota bacterium]|nr:pitrilysin family protein [Pseudomonadota bacterium]